MKPYLRRTRKDVFIWKSNVRQHPTTKLTLESFRLYGSWLSKLPSYNCGGGKSAFPVRFSRIRIGRLIMTRKTVVAVKQTQWTRFERRSFEYEREPWTDPMYVYEIGIVVMWLGETEKNSGVCSQTVPFPRGNWPWKMCGIESIYIGRIKVF